MANDKVMRVDEKFAKMVEDLRRQLERKTGRQVTNRTVTKMLAKQGMSKEMTIVIDAGRRRKKAKINSVTGLFDLEM